MHENTTVLNKQKRNMNLTVRLLLVSRTSQRTNLWSGLPRKATHSAMENLRNLADADGFSPPQVYVLVPGLRAQAHLCP